MSIKNTDLSVDEIEKIFTNSSKIFFIGIGGVSMASLAKFCLKMKKTVFGYDAKRNEYSAALEKSCHIKYCSSPDSVYGMDLIIYTTAISPDNFEYSSAEKYKIPLISRANFLGYVMSRYKNRIGVCGSHGKSTVSAMLAHIYASAKKDPCVFCGAKMNGYDSCELLGNGDTCIFEGCEYMNGFLHFNPTQSIITNIDYDHPDFFKSSDETLDSFQKYADLNKKIYINADDNQSTRIKHSNSVSYGIYNKADYTAKIRHSSALNSFSVYRGASFLGSCRLPLYGEHFIYDALSAFCAAYENGIDKEIIIEALSSYKGTGRRMEFIKKTDTGADVFTDYAHHPTEITAAIASLNAMGYKSITCIFQAHTFSRTFYLYEEFKKAFECVDNLIIAPTFSAREKNVFPFSDYSFALDCKGTFISDYEKISELVSVIKSDAIIILGAGDLLSKLQL